MGRRNNNSYADNTINGFRYGDVFTEKTTRSEGISCNSYANCYIGCECNTSKGWYSYCKEDDCHKVTDNHYTGVNSLSAGKNLNLNGQNISASGVKSGFTVASSGISIMSSGATTCYKVKSCEDGGYYSSEPDGKTCPKVTYNGKTCYEKDCDDACFDEASRLQAEIDNFNDAKYSFCDPGCKCNNVIYNCDTVRSDLMKEINEHNSRCPNNKVGGLGFCPAGGLCHPGGPAECYHCLR